MGVLDKKQLLLDIESRIGSIVTADESKQIIAAIGETISNYRIENVGELTGDSESLLSLFIEAKRCEGKSDKTLERYEYVLNRLQKDTGIPLNRITVYHLRSYINAEMKRGISASTMDGYRSVFSSFYGWCQNDGLIDGNPCANLAPIKKQKVERKPYAAEDIAMLQDNTNSKRDLALISFLMSTGCRISEVCQLNRDDIDLQTKQLKVLGKGNKERTVFIDDVTAMRLRLYLADRMDDSEALFVGRGSERMTPGGVRAMLNRIGNAAGIENVHPHRFRRTLATGLIDKGMSIQAVAAILGHEKLDTTMKYVFINKRNLENDYRRYA